MNEIEKFEPEQNPLYEAFAAIGITLIQALDALTESFALIAEAFANAFFPWNNLTEEMRITNTLAWIHYGEDYVVDKMGISRVDIRELKFREVRLWNHRRLPIDILDVVDYATTRAGSRRP